MNQLTQIQSTMSSREIAELTGKNHADVMRDIRKMLEDLGQAAAKFSAAGASSFAGSYLSEQNKSLPLFNLPKRECLILVSGYSVILRAKIIDRWEALGLGKAALLLLGNRDRTTQALCHQVAALAP